MLKFSSPAKSLLVIPELFLSLHLHLPFLLAHPWISFLNRQKTSYLIHLKFICLLQLLSLALPLGKSLTLKFWLYLLVEVTLVLYTNS